MSRIQIRRLTQSEVDSNLFQDLVELFQRSELARKYPRHFDGLSEEEAKYLEKTFVALQRKQVVGGTVYDFDFDLNRIVGKYLVVDPQFRNNGIGRQLIVALETFARERKIPGMAIDVRQHNPGEFDLITWYRSMGFSEFSRVGDQVYMKKDF